MTEKSFRFAKFSFPVPSFIGTVPEEIDLSGGGYGERK
jgi:hypothetical protein